MKEKIAQLAESFKDDIVAFLRDIISIPSMCGKETAVIQRIKSEMEKIGFEKIRIDGIGNLFGQIGTGDRIIALDGHCDTVDAGNLENWPFDPFKGKYENGIIYGRGASDQKGGLASAIYAGKVLKEIGIPKKISLLVVASVLEEDYEGACWKYIIEKDKIIPESVLLTEPSNLGIRIGQRGRMEIKVNTHGISCHGSAPERGENAIYKITPIIHEIETLNNRFHGESILGKATITVTEIRSTSPSLCAVPDNATLHLDRRLTEGETMETAIQEIRELKSVRDSDAQIMVPEIEVKSHTGLIIPIKAYYPMWIMEKNHPRVQSAVNAYRTQFSKEPKIDVWQFSTNGVTTKGLFDIPTIGFGPGEEKYAHTPQDQVRVSDLVEALEFYTAYVLG